jgi:hypothetical protein
MKNSFMRRQAPSALETATSFPASGYKIPGKRQLSKEGVLLRSLKAAPEWRQDAGQQANRHNVQSFNPIPNSACVKLVMHPPEAGHAPT